MERFKKLGYTEITKSHRGAVVSKENGERIVFERQEDKLYYAKVAGDNLPELVTPEEHEIISKIIKENS